MTYTKVLESSLKHLEIDIKYHNQGCIRFTCKDKGDIAPILTINAVLQSLGLIPYDIVSISHNVREWSVLIMNDATIKQFGTKL